ncbi:MAG: LysE family transporter [Chloroflexota bacterium]
MNSSLVGLFLFAAFMTGSPGPANLLMFAGSSRLGFIRSARFLIGLIIGKTLLNLAIGLGVGAFVSDESLIFTVLKVLSSAFIVYVAIGSLKSGEDHQADLAKFTFINGLFVHPLSPKTWSMILLAHSQISDSGFDYPVRVLIIWATFTCGAIIFHSSWGVAGSFIGKALNQNLWVSRVVLFITILFVIWFLIS